MKVLHVIPSIARSAGGPSEVVRELLPELEKHGVSVTLVTTDKGATDLDSDVLRKENVRVSKSLLSRWTFAPGIVRTLWKEVGASDVVHVHSVHTFPSTVAMLVSHLRKKPVVLQPHGALNRYHIRQRRAVKVGYLKLVDGLGLRAVRVALYSSQIEIADGTAVLPTIPPRLLPLGIDQRILGIARAEQNPPRVLFLARLAKKKRVDLLLEALARPELSGVELEAVIAGPIDADLDYDPIAMNDALNGNRAHLVGQVGADARAKLLSSASVYVLPSDDESFGMSVAEAMGAGCAVVCSPFVGVASDAQSFGATVIIDQDAGQLAAAIRRLIESPDERDELGTRARRYASENLTWSQIARRLAGYYSQTVEASA